MRSAPLLALAALAAPLSQAASVGQPARNVARHNGRQKGATLPADTFNKGSTLTGLEPESKPGDGQTPSTT